MSNEALATVGVAILIIISVMVWLAKRQLDGIVNGIASNNKKIEELKVDWQAQQKENERQRKESEDKTEKEIQRVEQDLNNLKADLPMIYTLREDFIRSMNNVENKISSIDGKIDKLLQRE